MNGKRALKQFHRLGELSTGMRLAAESWDVPWKTLIATMMSAQSRDETTIPIANSLFRKYKALESLSRAGHKSVLRVLRSLNYNRTKAKNIIACAHILVKEHKGKVPEDFNELVKLPGVGRKTANVFLSEMGHDTIGVDTHVAYISQKLGWTKNKDPEKIEADLKALFPKKSWKKVNPTLVRFGKAHTNRRAKDKILWKIMMGKP